MLVLFKFSLVLICNIIRDKNYLFMAHGIIYNYVANIQKKSASTKAVKTLFSIFRQDYKVFRQDYNIFRQK